MPSVDLSPQYPPVHPSRSTNGTNYDERDRGRQREPIFYRQHDGAQDGANPPVAVKDFQDHQRTVPRKPSTPSLSTSSPRLRSGPTPPMPDGHHRFRHPIRDDSLQGNHRQPRVEDHASRSPSSVSAMSSDETYDTQATSVQMPPLQAESALESYDKMEPLQGDLAGSFDLVEPLQENLPHQGFSLEVRSLQMFSHDHLKVVFEDPALLLRFTAFLSTHRPQSVPILVYYLDALKALKAVKYANAIAEALSPIPGHEFTLDLAPHSANAALKSKADQAFDAMVKEDLPAYVTQMYIQIVSLSISQRITGVLAPHLREASEGLAEVFCLTDPSRPDNPIVFASEEFCRTTQYGMGYTIGRNCRFLQGPKTNPLSVRRLRDAVRSGREQSEVFLNYRRDGSPFMNLLMIAPLCDSRGKIRYNIGAQVDVSGLAKDCTDLESLQNLVVQQQDQYRAGDRDGAEEQKGKRDEFQELSEMLNMGELETVRKHGGRMHRDYQEEDDESSRNAAIHRPRLLLEEPNPDPVHGDVPGRNLSGRLKGVYQNYLLIRPYPSLRILFASPTLRVPGILQSPFMNKIGGSSRVQDELTAALAEGRGVTAKVRWISKADEEGRNRWIHCTPLIGSNGQIGVWMVVLIDDDQGMSRRWKQAPPVATARGKDYGSSREGRHRGSEEHGSGGHSAGSSIRNEYRARAPADARNGNGSLRSESPNSVRIY